MAAEPIDMYKDAADALGSGAIIAQCSGSMCSVIVEGTSYDVVASVTKGPADRVPRRDCVTIWFFSRPLNESKARLYRPRWDMRFIEQNVVDSRRSKLGCTITAHGRCLKFLCGTHNAEVDVCGLPKHIAGARLRSAVKSFLYRSRIADELAVAAHKALQAELKMLSTEFLSTFEQSVIERPRGHGKSTLVQDIVAAHRNNIMNYVEYIG